MTSPQDPDMFRALPSQRPTVQREYTAITSTRQACTPSTSHGFIPLGTASPLPTDAAERSSSSTTDYLSLPKKQAVISPDAVGYESHGFIPLCSVAGVERKDEAGDYFSHFENQANTQPSNSNSHSNSNPNSNSTSSTRKHAPSPSSPRQLDFTDPPRLSHDKMMHPTGTPVHPRDVLLPVQQKDSGSDRKHDLTVHNEGNRKAFLGMRGGAIHNPLEHAFEAERSRCNLTVYPMKDRLEETELNDELLPTEKSSLERHVSGHDSQAFSEIGPNRPKSVAASKERIRNRKSWEEDWLRIAEALELPVSEASEKDGDDDSIVESQLRAEDMSPQASHNNNAVAGSHPVTAVVSKTQPSFRFTSLEADNPMPELPSAAAPTKQTVQVIPPANLLSVPRSQRRPRLDKRHSSPVATAESSTIQVKQPTQATNRLSVPRSLARPFAHKRHSPPIPPNLTILKTAMHTDLRYLTSLLNGPTISITSSAPSKMIIPSVPLSMLTHFCPPAIILPLLSADSSSLILPSTTSCKAGLPRVLRFMTRCCLPHSHSSNSELPIPTGDLSAGIETVLACDVLGLHPDATRLTSLILSTQLTGPLSSALIDELWNNHNGTLRSSPFGDIVVYSMLRESWKNEHGRAEEVIWMLEQPEYSELKERVRAEVGLRIWRKETREEFLARWEKERERKVKRRERKETVERERERRVDEIRMRNLEGQKSGERRSVGDKARRGLNLRVDKAVPKISVTPAIRIEGETGAMRDAEDERDSAAAMYAEYARSFLKGKDVAPRREVGTQKSRERIESNSSIPIVSRRSVPLPQYEARPSSRTWEISGAAPVPRKKLSLWEKLKF